MQKTDANTQWFKTTPIYVVICRACGHEREFIIPGWDITISTAHLDENKARTVIMREDKWVKEITEHYEENHSEILALFALRDEQTEYGRMAQVEQRIRLDEELPAY